jgi:hypothetical protein
MDLFDEYSAKRNTALSILFQVGALSSCPIHEEIIDGGKDVTAAYKLGMSKWAIKKHPEFESAREFTDYIKEIYEEYSECECGSCINT